MPKWRKLSKYVLMVIIFLVSLCVAVAQITDADLRQELDEIKQNQQSMQQDLLEIKALLSRLVSQIPSQIPSQKPAPQQQYPPQKPSPKPPPMSNINGVTFDIGDNPVLGSDSAKFIVVEFTDYECPYCGGYTRETFPGIRKQYIDKGAIRYAVIDQPLPIHPDAAKAAEAAHCAEDQGKFWEVHEAMMAKQDDLKDLSSYATDLRTQLTLGV